MLRLTGVRTEFLRWKIGAFLLGAILGLTAIFLDLSWLVTVALVVLIGGVLLRRIPSNDTWEEEPPDRSN